MAQDKVDTVAKRIAMRIADLYVELLNEAYGELGLDKEEDIGGPEMLAFEAKVRAEINKAVC